MAKRLASKIVPKLAKTKLLVTDINGLIADKYNLIAPHALREHFKTYNINITNKDLRTYDGVHKHLIDKYSNNHNGDYYTSLWKAYCSHFMNEINQYYFDYMEKKLNLTKDHKYYALTPYSADTLKFLKNVYNDKLLIGVKTRLSKDCFHAIYNTSFKQYNLNWVFDKVITDHRARQKNIYELMNKTNVTDVRDVVVLCSDQKDVLEAKNAGAFVVGVARYSSKMGEFFDEHYHNKINYDFEYLEQNNPNKYKDCLQASYFDLAKYKPHYVIKDLSQLPCVLNMIDYKRTTEKNPIANTHTKFY
jgi:beta-phosphoglucomutase-like phosphatase (HAD superfamily)